MATLDEVLAAHHDGAAKLRIYMEYQYCESFDFFTTFNRIDRL